MHIAKETYNLFKTFYDVDKHKYADIDIFLFSLNIVKNMSNCRHTKLIIIQSECLQCSKYISVVGAKYMMHPLRDYSQNLKLRLNFHLESHHFIEL